MTIRLVITSINNNKDYEYDTLLLLAEYNFSAVNTRPPSPVDGHVNTDHWTVEWERGSDLLSYQKLLIADQLNQDSTIFSYHWETISNLMDPQARVLEDLEVGTHSNWGGRRPGAGRKPSKFALRVGDQFHAVGGGVHAQEIYEVTGINKVSVTLTSESGWKIVLVR